jgi:thymidylate synthase
MKYNTPTEAFEKVYQYISENGEEYAGTKAVFNLSFTVSYPEEMVITTPERKFKKDYADFEWEWYLKGNRDASEISERAKIWKNMMVPGTTNVVSNYGYFWNYNDQLYKMIEELKRNNETRRAVLVHYGIFEIDMYKYDTPCNLVLNFYIRNGGLHLTVFARSIDLVYGWCNDQYTFSKLMELVSSRVKIPVGSMHWFITNCHLYPKHYNLFNK